jgi:murein DD-endopeptidase MepM/ murein hydrolase activator NlpD
MAPPVAARRASIESRSLAPLSIPSARNASTMANGLDAQKTTAAAPPAVVASLPPAPPAAAPSWYDWMMPATPPAASSDDELHFLWPVEGRIVSPFGDNPNGGRNDGINISVPRGTPIRAADAGEVSYVGNELKGYGNLILIRHDNGFVTAYAHTDGVHVKRGERVERGQVIASVGDTGDVSQPQLHFELRYGTQPVDPTPYLVEAPNEPRTGSRERLAEGAR